MVPGRETERTSSRCLGSLLACSKWTTPGIPCHWSDWGDLKGLRSATTRLPCPPGVFSLDRETSTMIRGEGGQPALPFLTNASPLQADVLLLCSSEPHSLTYIETTELDG